MSIDVSAFVCTNYLLNCFYVYYVPNHIVCKYSNSHLVFSVFSLFFAVNKKFFYLQENRGMINRLSRIKKGAEEWKNIDFEIENMCNNT